MARQYKQWTRPEEATLRTLRAQGATWEHIALALGRSVVSVQKRFTAVTDSPRTDLRGRIMRRVQIDEATGCWIWTGMLNAGHPRVMLTARRGHEAQVHPRKALLQLDGKWRNTSMATKPTCGDALCIAPDHAKQLTQEQHLRGARRKPGQTSVAERVRIAERRRAVSPLSWELVNRAREERASGVSRLDILRWWPCSKATLDDVLAGRTWREVIGPAASVFSWRPNA